jgi:hypothetical protein
VGPLPDELAELLYRERFGLSYRQMQAEPTDVVRYWLAVEEERAKEHKRLSNT